MRHSASRSLLAGRLSNFHLQICRTPKRGHVYLIPFWWPWMPVRWGLGQCRSNGNATDLSGTTEGFARSSRAVTLLDTREESVQYSEHSSVKHGAKNGRRLERLHKFGSVQCLCHETLLKRECFYPWTVGWKMLNHSMSVIGRGRTVAKHADSQIQEPVESELFVISEENT